MAVHSKLSGNLKDVSLGGLSTSQQLYAVCHPKSAYVAKLILKQASFYDPKQPVISSKAILDPSPTSSSIKIPTTLTRILSNQTGAEPPTTDQLLNIDDPSIHLPANIPHSLFEHLIGFQWLQASAKNIRLKHLPVSPLLRAIQRFFSSNPPQDLLEHPPTWEAYQDFILFQPNAFLSAPWSHTLNSTSIASNFFALVASEFGVSHLARKGLIDRSDVSRQPQLVPLHGVFRTQLNAEGHPKSFNDAFWTSTRFSTPKGSITYVWAPSETMYSRGNSSEKCRIAMLPNVTSKIVVDMCCGIGFFVFPYLLAGASKVIGCEISQWAIEGLRRSAVANGISYKVLDQPSGLDSIDLLSHTAKLIIAPGPNALALPIYRQIATHVNLGLLPSSVQFLPQAVEALRPEGGWLHIHGELAVGGGPVGRKQGAEAWAATLIECVRHLGRQSTKLVNIHWIKSIGPAKEHIVVELEVGLNNQVGHC